MTCKEQAFHRELLVEVECEILQIQRDLRALAAIRDYHAEQLVEKYANQRAMAFIPHASA